MKVEEGAVKPISRYRVDGMRKGNIVSVSAASVTLKSRPTSWKLPANASAWVDSYKRETLQSTVRWWIRLLSDPSP
jgi:hypothetical protein